MKRVEFVVGNEWQHDVRYLDELRPVRPADSTPNLAEIGDIVDLVVGSKNVTASVSEESIFPFVADLCEGLIELAEGRRRKVIVEFRREPWELVLVPNGRAVEITIYSLDDDARIVAHNERVDAMQLVRTVGDAAQQLVTDLFAISDAFGSDPFVRRFSSHVGRMKRLNGIRFDEQDDAVERGRAGSTSAASGLTLSYDVDVGSPAFQNYDGEQPYDLHALLVSGNVRCEWRGHEVPICDDFPFLALQGLVGRTRELFNAIESDRNRFRCDDRLPRGTWDVVGESERWTIVAGLDESLLEFELPQGEVLEALVSFAEMLLSDIEDSNPTIQLNQRFFEVAEDVSSLRVWLGDFGGSNTYMEAPEEYLRENGNVRPAEETSPTADFPWPFESVRKLRPSSTWRFEDEQIHFGSITATRDHLLVPTSRALTVLDVSSGDPVWKTETLEERPSSYAICGPDVVISHPDRHVEIRDIATGSVACEVDDVGTFLLDAAFYPGNDLAVVAEFHGTLSGIRRKTGEVAWRRDEDDSFLSGAHFEGPLVCTLSVSGYLTAFNPLDGKTLWRVKIGGAPEGGPRWHRGRIYTISHDENSRALSIHSVYPFTGRVAWQLRIDGWVAGEPVFHDDLLLLPVERYGRVTMHAIPVEDFRPETAWKLELTSAGLDRPTRVRVFHIDGVEHGIVRTDRSDLMAFRMSDGELRWRVQTDPKTTLLYRNLDLEIVQSAAVSVGESIQIRSLATGELLHRFAGVMVAPEFARVVGSMGVIVGEAGADDGFPDEVVRHDLDHFLAVVQ